MERRRCTTGTYRCYQATFGVNHTLIALLGRSYAVRSARGITVIQKVSLQSMMLLRSSTYTRIQKEGDPIAVNQNHIKTTRCNYSHHKNQSKSVSDTASNKTDSSFPKASSLGPHHSTQILQTVEPAAIHHASDYKEKSRISGRELKCV